ESRKSVPGPTSRQAHSCDFQPKAEVMWRLAGQDLLGAFSPRFGRQPTFSNFMSICTVANRRTSEVQSDNSEGANENVSPFNQQTIRNRMSALDLQLKFHSLSAPAGLSRHGGISQSGRRADERTVSAEGS